MSRPSQSAGPPAIRLRYFQKVINWGDAINPYLVGRLTGRPVDYYSETDTDIGPHLLAAGSIGHWITPDSVVWGTGVLWDSIPVTAEPKAILAVRGPLTRAVLCRHGFACPEVYGDPALLLPQLYRPKRMPRHPLGVVPHYVDEDTPFIKRCRQEGITVIDVASPIEVFVQEVMSCEGILSSSLHGLICADAYGIPNRWIEISDKVIGKDFKFRDYYGSRGLEIPAHTVTGETDPKTLIGECRLHPLNLNTERLRRALLDHVNELL